MEETPIIYHIAPLGWTENEPNPFTPDGSYGPEWSVFRLRDEDDYNIINGRQGGPAGPYCFLPGRGVLDAEARYGEIVRAEPFRGCRIMMPIPPGVSPEGFIGSCYTGIETRLADFLKYENAHGRKVIVSFPPDTDAVVTQALAETPDRSEIRPDDSRWWVHSTPLPNWEKIQACRELRSHARLRQEGLSQPGVGLFAFGEPVDYAEYVMLAWALAVAPEHVVSSQQKGRLITEEDTPYEPGVRLYFDGHRIIRDGLAVSDGLHLLKVHDHLPLDQYLVAAISAGDADPTDEVETWTPWTFLNASNEYFIERYACKQDRY